MRERKNEIAARNAFIEILQKIKGVEYFPESRPEDEDRNIPAIDFILAPKDENKKVPKIAVEHTIVEAHDRQIEYVNHSYDIVEKINQKCKGKLPTNRCFQLIIPPDLIVATSRKKRDKLIEKISGWIPDVTKTLTDRDQYSSILYDGYKVLLTCIGSVSEMNGNVGRMPTRPEDGEEKRKARFHRAIKEKLPKLIKYKKKGYMTALLLEDISFSHALPKDNWKDIIPEQCHSEFKSQIDYVVIFVSNQEKMVVGNVWKEGFQIYTEIPDNRRFSLMNRKRGKT